MFSLLIAVHVIVSLVLILVVLLQSGKAGDLASAFGGAGSQAAFGARGAATFLTKMTTVCAVLFMVTSLGLAIMYNQGESGSVMEDLPEQAPVETPLELPGGGGSTPASEEDAGEQGEGAGEAAGAAAEPGTETPTPPPSDENPPERQ